MTKNLFTPVQWLACLLAMGLVLQTPAGRAETITFANAEFAETVRVGNSDLELVSLARLYYRVIFTGAAVGLYLNNSADLDKLLDDVPKRLEFVYFGSLDAGDFVDAANESLARNVDEDTLEELRDAIDEFNAFYVDIKKHDRYSISYTPEYGLELALNGERLGRVENNALAAIYFRIWFGEQPFNSNLKLSLLEGKR